MASMPGGPRVRNRRSISMLALLLVLPWTLVDAGRPLAHTAARARPAAQSQEHPLEPPQVLFGDLFVAVQSAAVFPDGKAFVDATPSEPPARILAEYHAAHPDSPEAL